MKLDVTDISKSASAAAIVFDALRKAIVEGELKDGSPLRQDEIARMFNTSRIPVREAITMLEQQGLVKTRRYKGAVVAGLSREEANEIFEFRALLEGNVIGSAVPQMAPESLQTARDCLEAFSNSTDPMKWGTLNREFHYALYKDCGKPYHLQVVSNSLDRVDRFLRAQLVLSDGMDRANKEHTAILEACARGDADAASDLTRQHILGAKQNLLDLLETNGTI